jgi:hypothetical protein
MRVVCIAAALLAGIWVLDGTYHSHDQVWVHTPEPADGHARILRFYATAGTVAPGQPVRLCYSVENARSVRISPLVSGIYPAHNYCLELAPEHTMHFTLWAEGFDGSVAARSFTLPVQMLPTAPARKFLVAWLRPPTAPAVAGD